MSELHLPLLRLEAARGQMLAGLSPLPMETVPIGEALGRVLAAGATARVTLPPWDNSAMDGFAVRSGDVASASPHAAVELRVVGEVAAGHPPDVIVEPRRTARILTGAMLPAGADAVVPVEETDAVPGDAELPSIIRIHRAVEPGAHVRLRGSDLEAGDRLADGGTRLNPAWLAVLAAAGIGEVPVYRRPRVAILGTGDELVPPGMPLGPAQIPDSNSVSLSAQARAAGADVVVLGVARDRQDEVVAHLREGIATADIVVVSGGVSVGAHDEVKAAFGTVGRMDLWRVAIQPGKPLAFGRATAPDGRDVLLFGLPGNPVSSFVTFELFVRPVLRRLAGHPDPIGRRVVRARVTAPVTKSSGRRAFLRVRLLPDPERPGALIAELAGGQGSHVLSALARSNGLAIIPEDVDGLPAGSIVDVLRIDEESS
jgi:molybdenum cofactor synthesis domain-containing protein